MRMIFKNAYFKLTVVYVTIVMVISVSFSVVLYRISSAEISRGLGRENRVMMGARGNPIIDDLEQLRNDQLDESNSRLRLNLIYFNLLILVLSAVASYFLAQKTLQPIEEAMEAQNRFTADASHELRTPLTAMKTEIEVALREKQLSLERSKELLQSNLEEIGKLESLSNALLKLAKAKDSNKSVFRKVLLSDLIVESYEKIESLAREKQIGFDNSFEDIYTLGDRESLIELFVILLDNAIKYSPKKTKIKIKISKADGKAIVEIADQGIGIKASDLPHIFERFYRADHSRTKEQASGYGLGLSIAKQIVDMHDGAITVESHPGKGSVFTVKLEYVE